MIALEFTDTRTGSPAQTNGNWVITIDAATKILIVVVHGLTQAGSTPTASTVNGLTMTKLWELTNGTRLSQLWYRVNPPTGSQTVAWTGDTASHTLCVDGARGYSGVNTDTPFGTDVSATGSATTMTVDVTGTVSGDLVIDALTVNSIGETVTVDGSQAEEYNTFDGAKTFGVGSSEAGGGTVTMSWTRTGANTPWVTGAVALKALVVAETILFRRKV